MQRIAAVDPATTQGRAKDLLAGVQKTLGMTPNLMRAMAQSPAALEAYLGFGKTLGTGVLGGKLRESIALAVAGANGCNYCAAAHGAIGKMLGLTAEEAVANLDSRSADPNVAAALGFVRALVDKRGWAGAEDLAAVRAAGYDEGEIVEMIAAVALNTFSNYFNHVARTDIDFPPLREAA